MHQLINKKKIYFYLFIFLLINSILNLNFNKNLKDKFSINSIIVNTARGGIINELDLEKALNEDIIFGAALDVFSKEPAKENILFNNIENPIQDIGIRGI